MNNMVKYRRSSSFATPGPDHLAFEGSVCYRSKKVYNRNPAHNSKNTCKDRLQMLWIDSVQDTVLCVFWVIITGLSRTTLKCGKDACILVSKLGVNSGKMKAESRTGNRLPKRSAASLVSKEENDLAVAV